MRFLVKTIGKKALAVVCTFALLLSVMSVCFGAFATNIVYTVPASKPAIPVEAGKTIDLSKIAVQFDATNTYDGADLVWSTDDTSGSIVVDDAAKKIINFGSDIVAVKATHTATSTTKTIYLVYPDATSGEAVLYDHNFSASDISNNDFTEASEWIRWYVPGSVTSQESKFGIQYYFNNTLANDNGKVISSAMYYIRPESATGKLVSAFSDLTVEVVSVSRGNPNWSGVAFRIDTTNWTKQSINSGTDLVYTAATVYGRTESQTAASVASPWVNGTQGTSVSLSKEGSGIYQYIGVYSDTTDKPSDVPYGLYFHKTSVNAVGNNVTVQYTSSKDATGTVAVTSSVPVTYTLSGDADTTGGTAGVVMYGDSRNIGLHSFKALITFTPEQLAGMKDASAGGYLSAGPIVIDAAKPVIPAIVGKGIDLSNVMVKLADGTMISATQLTWSADSSVTNAVVNDANKIILYTGEGIAPVKATNTTTNTEVTFYIAQPDAVTNEVVLYDHTFSASDISNNDFTEASEWEVWYADDKTPQSLKLSIQLYYNNTLAHNNDYTASSALYYIRPESASGRLISAFSDLTIETVNVARGTQGSFGVAFRTDTTNWTKQAIGSGTDLVYTAAAVYPRTYAQAGTASPSYIFINGTNVSNTNLTELGTSNAFSVVLKDYTVTEGYTKPAEVPYALYYNKTRVTAAGNEITVQYTKSKDAAGTVEPVISNPVTHTLTETADLTGGTAGFITYADSRNLGMYSFKALVTLTTEELAGMKSIAEGGYLFDIVKVDKPVADATVFTYSGADQTYTVADNSNYTVTGNVQKDAGEYTVTVALKDKVHSTWADGTTADITFPFNIAKKAITVKADAKSVEMGKTEPALTYTAEGKIDGEALVGELTREAGTTVGTYAILQGTVTNANNPNYDITYVGAEFKITKTNQAAIAIAGAPTGDIIYGDEFTLSATGGSSTGDTTWAITEGAQFATVDSATGKVTVTGVGTVKVTATKAGDANYEPVTADYTFTSVKATPVVSGVAVSGKVYDTTAPGAVVLTKQSGPDGTFTITDAAMSKTQTTYNWKFTPTDSANYEETTGTVTINVIETVAPTIKITSGSNEWTATPGSITFDILSNAAVNFTIDYADEVNGSGIKDKQYFVSQKALTATELESVTWLDYNGAFTVTSEGKYVVYARATDNDGNVTVISSNGVVIDTTAPVITGVEDGKTYDGDIIVAVEDALVGIKKVKLDGVDVTLTNGRFTVKGDNAKHTITVIDNLGNEDEIEITVNKLYTVTFIDGDKVHAIVKVKDGEKVTMPELPKKDGYTAAWDKTVETVTEDTVIKVVYTEIPKSEVTIIIPETNAVESTIAGSAESIKEKVPFTDKEKQEIALGADIDIHLEIKDIAKEVPAGEKALIAEKLGDNTVGAYLDITMIKKVGNNEGVILTKLNDKVQATLKLPENLINTDKNVVRTYSIIHVHDGIVEIINPKFDANANTLSFETDKFSTYAIVYKDAPVEADTPKTEDTTNLWIWAVMLVLCAAAMTSVVCFKKAKQN